MLDGAHFVPYSRNATTDRAFLREVLGLPSVDAGDGWLIFALPAAVFSASTNRATHGLALPSPPL